MSKSKKDKLDEIFAIRCFLNRRRKLTHELTKREAKYFKKCGLHLVKYLNEEYKLLKK